MGMMKTTLLLAAMTGLFLFMGELIGGQNGMLMALALGGGTLRRIRNRYNQDVNGYFLCDRGRYGYEFVKDVDFLDKGAADIILSHHERFDGSGYPRGLKGEEVSLGARIFSVVDAVDAMVHDRPYHRATTFPAACEEIIRHIGTHFDPDVVEPALTHMENYLEIPL